MRLEYEKFTPTSYDNERGEECGDTVVFEYEIDTSDIKQALPRIIMKEFEEDNLSKNVKLMILLGIKTVIDKIDDAYLLEEFADYYYEDLLECFERDAVDWYEED